MSAKGGLPPAEFPTHFVFISATSDGKITAAASFPGKSRPFFSLVVVEKQS